MLAWPEAETRHDPASRGRQGSANLVSDGDVEDNPGPPQVDRAGRMDAAMSADAMQECCRARVKELTDAGTELTVENLSQIFILSFGTYRQRERALRSVPSSLPKGFSRLIRRMNRQIKAARSSNRKRVLVELLTTRKTLMRDAKRELKQKQRTRNMENFAVDPCKNTVRSSSRTTTT